MFSRYKLKILVLLMAMPLIYNTARSQHISPLGVIHNKTDFGVTMGTATVDGQTDYKVGDIITLKILLYNASPSCTDAGLFPAGGVQVTLSMDAPTFDFVEFVDSTNSAGVGNPSIGGDATGLSISFTNGRDLRSGGCGDDGIVCYFRVRAKKAAAPTTMSLNTEQLDFTAANLSPYNDNMPYALNISNVTILPLKLTSYGVTNDGHNGALVKWTVAEQVNTLRFDVERSTNGANFTTIGSKAAAGNYAGNMSYTFTDASPNAGTNYYRLKMVDIDDKVIYSDVKWAAFGQVKDISISPNPAKDWIYVSGANTGAIIRIMDLNGRLLQTQKLTNAVTGINISALAPSVYIAQVIENNTVITTTRIIKQ